MHLTRTCAAAVAVAALTTLSLTACGSVSTGSASSPSASSNGITSLSADQILAKATTAAKAQSSVHASGSGSSDGTTVAMDLQMQKGTGGSGSVTVGGSKLQLVVTTSDVYIKADKAYWTKSGGAAAAATIGDRWVKAPRTNAAFGPLADLADLGSAMDSVLKPDGTLSVGQQASVAGQPAIALVDSKGGGKLWVATTGDPLPLRIDGASGGGSLQLTDWGQAVTVTVPPASDVLDLATLTG